MLYMNLLNNFTPEEIQNILNTSNSFKEVVLKIGYAHDGGGGYRYVKNYILKHNLSTPKYSFYGNVHKTTEMSIDEVFIVDSPYTSTQGLKRKILKYGLLKYECVNCKNTGMWNDKKLLLQLDHINGIFNDNRIENLRFLCPNCHSQTTTFCGKNVKNKRQYRRSRSEYVKEVLFKNDEKNKDIIQKVINANIDFTKRGYITKVSRIIGITPQKTKRWIRRNLPNVINQQ